MGLLDELFGGATGNGIDLEAILQKAAAGLQQRGQGPLEAQSTAARIAAMPQQVEAPRDVRSYVDQGSEYTPAPQTAATAPTAAARPQYAGRQPTTQQRLMNAFSHLQGSGTDIDRAAETENMTVRALMSRGMDQDTALTLARNPAALQKVLVGLSGTAANKYGKAGAVFQDAQGNFHTIQFAEDGTRKIEPLQGLTPARGTGNIDTGTEIITQDKATGRAIGSTPKDVAGEARAKKYGMERGEMEANRPQANAALNNAESGLNRLEREATAIKNNPALAGITGVPGMFPNWPGGEAANVKANLDALKSQVGFAVLQAMRDASKTGGALGAISDRENELLQNNLAALQQSQSFEQFKTNLGKIIEFSQQSKERLRRAYRETYGEDYTPTGAAPAQSGGGDAGGYKVLGVR